MVGQVSDSDEVWVVLNPATNESSRPVALKKLRKGLAIGKLTKDMLVTRSGENAWVSLGELLQRTEFDDQGGSESAPVLAAAPAAAAAPPQHHHHRAPSRPSAVDLSGHTMPTPRPPTDEPAWRYVRRASHLALIFGSLVLSGHVLWSMKREVERDRRELARDDRELAREAHEKERELAAVATRGALAMQASTNVQGAHITLTNLDDQVTKYACAKGIVRRKSSIETVESVVVCSGDLKPHSTASLEAPYRVGAVMDLCSEAKRTYFGVRQELDWDLCEFEVVMVNEAGKPMGRTL